MNIFYEYFLFIKNIHKKAWTLKVPSLCVILDTNIHIHAFLWIFFMNTFYS